MCALLHEKVNLTLAWVATADLREAVRIALADILAPAKVLLREAPATCPTKGVRHAATCKAKIFNDDKDKVKLESIRHRAFTNTGCRS
jgi:hypothetical protein